VPTIGLHVADADRFLGIHPVIPPVAGAAQHHQPHRSWRVAAKTLCGRCGWCRTLAGVFWFAVFVACAVDRVGMTAASALLSPEGLLAPSGARR
jgi:hypothetical protein